MLGLKLNHVSKSGPWSNVEEYEVITHHSSTDFYHFHELVFEKA